MVVIAALYQFVDVHNPVDCKKQLEVFCQSRQIKGTLLLATEGINGTIAGTRQAIDELQSWLATSTPFTNLEYKESLADYQPFYRLKVRIKREIVTLGVAGVQPTKQRGTYLNSRQWNELLRDPEVCVIDTRNDYEINIGSFKGAINPQTNCFTEFPKIIKEKFNPQIHKKIAMYCTGGIRCEKASSYMKMAGFEEVYHLKGGILKYLADMPPKESLWQGDCFVFDQRVAVDCELNYGSYTMCHGCRLPLSKADQQSEFYEVGVSCANCREKLSVEKIKNLRERQKQILLSKARGEAHMGALRPLHKNSLRKSSLNKNIPKAGI